MMNTINKERLAPLIERLEHYATNVKWTNVQAAQDILIAVDAIRIALASLEAEKNAEPVAKVETVGVCWYADNGVPRKPAVGTELYAAPPAPVAVPTFEEWCERTEQKPVGWVRDAMKEAYDGCRAARLTGNKN